MIWRLSFVFKLLHLSNGIAIIIIDVDLGVRCDSSPVHTINKFYQLIEQLNDQFGNVYDRFYRSRSDHSLTKHTVTSAFHICQ